MSSSQNDNIVSSFHWSA